MCVCVCVCVSIHPSTSRPPACVGEICLARALASHSDITHLSSHRRGYEPVAEPSSTALHQQQQQQQHDEEGGQREQRRQPPPPLPAQAADDNDANNDTISPHAPTEETSATALSSSQRCCLLWYRARCPRGLSVLLAILIALGVFTAFGMVIYHSVQSLQVSRWLVDRLIG